LIASIVAIARAAGARIMEIYAQDFTVEMKEDRSPLTQADREANAIILEGLEACDPGIPRISEETKLIPYAIRRDWPSYWLIDPLDGTKEFIKKNGEFTVNIARVENGKPVMGVVYLPARNICYYADGQGAFRADEQGRITPLRKGPSYLTLQKIRVVASRSHLDEHTMNFVENLKQAGKEVEFVSSGSSIKFCLVADGSADVYPRFAPTMEWDTAAGQAVVELAGGRVLQAQSREPLLYNKENLLNPFFIVE